MSKGGGKGLLAAPTVTERRLDSDLSSFPSSIYLCDPLEKPRQPPPCPPRLVGDSSLESQPTMGSHAPVAETTAGVVRHWCEAYAWELLGLAVAASALAAIAVLAATSDGRPASVTALAAATGPFKLNALVALLATIGKGAMLSTVGLCMAQLKWARFTSSGSSACSPPRPLSEFCAIDQASRGAAGSLAALPAIFATPLVLFGALVMVVAVIFDFAAQQLISLEPRTVQFAAAAGDTAVPRAQYFFHSSSGNQEERIPAIFAPGTGLVATIDNGCGGDPSALDVAATCPTGNCTFPVFNTLAMCSKCVDISKQLVRLALEPVLGDSHAGKNDSTVYKIKWIAPGNATVVQRVVGLNSNGRTLNQTFVVSSHVGIQWPALGWPEYAVAPLGLTIMKFRPRPMAADAVAAPPVGAWQCGISPCVRTLAVSVVNGRQRTSVLAEYKNDTQLATWLRDGGGYTLRPPIAPEKHLWESAAAAMAKKHGGPAGDPGVHDTNGPAPPLLRPNILPVFEINYGGMFLLAGVLKSFFTGTYELSHQILIADDGSPIDLPSGRGPYYLNDTRDVPGLVSNVSEALTSYLRRQQPHSKAQKQKQQQQQRPAGPFRNSTAPPPPPRQQPQAASDDLVGDGGLRGVATTQQVFVAVAWAWLALPLALLGCASALLPATALYSSARGAPLWKDSCLPMIFHGLDEAGLPARFRGGKHGRREMQAVARDLNVAIRQVPSGLHDRPRFMAEREVWGLSRKG